MEFNKKKEKERKKETPSRAKWLADLVLAFYHVSCIITLAIGTLLLSPCFGFFSYGSSPTLFFILFSSSGMMRRSREQYKTHEPGIGMHKFAGRWRKKLGPGRATLYHSG